jgi:hypothetical protein
LRRIDSFSIDWIEKKFNQINPIEDTPTKVTFALSLFFCLVSVKRQSQNGFFEREINERTSGT